jgi:glycosyltransferase involved in cell wall biosynthesis
MGRVTTIVYDGTIYNSQMRGGISRYYTQLIEHMAPLAPEWDFQIHVNSGPTAPLPAAPNARVIRRRYFRPRRLFFPLNSASRVWHTRAARPALVHSTLYRPLRFRGGCPLVVTIHDVIAHLRRDLHPGPSGDRFRAWVEWSAARAAVVLTVSETSRDDIARVLGIPAERIRVAHPGLDPAFAPPTSAEVIRFKASRGLERPYVLYVGHRAEHKNFKVVADAFRLPEMAGFDLLPVGGDSGPISDAELRCAYAGAAAFVFPSLCEGFGLPLLEAMSCGAPIAASDIPTNREVAGAACVLFDPTDAHACAWAIREAAGPARTGLLAAAPERLARFTWNDCAAATLRVYREVLDQ